jgi:outer membrane protein TolC
VPGIADVIKPMPHEQYKITIDINQTIYDGGAVKNARALEKAGLNINNKQTEADIYKLRGQINTYYFNLLLLDRKKELLDIYYDLISKRIMSMESAFRNGVITGSDIDILESERIRITQQLKENQIIKSSLLKILADLTGQVLDDSTILSLPVSDFSLTDELSRPELDLFDLRKEQLEAGIKATESKRMPKAFGFATLGYGNPPGNNFLKDEFASYFIVGAAIKWNILDWNKTRNEKQLISLQQNILENRKTDLTDNLNRLLEAKNAEITNLESMLESDTVLISLRKKITSSAESQYENGIITASELLKEMNSEKEARINYEIHKISLAMARIEYLNISGKEIE